MVYSAYRGRVLEGFVDKVYPCGKTVAIVVHSKFRHKTYGKVVNKKRRFFAESSGFNCAIGDKILIKEIPPKSKMKNWRVLELLK